MTLTLVEGIELDSDNLGQETQYFPQILVSLFFSIALFFPLCICVWHYCICICMYMYMMAVVYIDCHQDVFPL